MSVDIRGQALMKECKCGKVVARQTQRCPHCHSSFAKRTKAPIIGKPDAQGNSRYKLCPDCNTTNGRSRKYCPCGHQFVNRTKLQRERTANARWGIKQITGNTFETPDGRFRVTRTPSGGGIIEWPKLKEPLKTTIDREEYRVLLEAK